MKLSPTFVFFVFFLIFGFPLIMVFGDHIFFGKKFMDYILLGGIVLCLLIGISIMRKAFKNSSTKKWYTKPGSGMASVTSNYFSNPKISNKRKAFIILLPIVLCIGVALLVILATIYKIL